MSIGIGTPIFDLASLPGASRPGGGGGGGGGLAQIDNLNSMSFDGTSDFIKVRDFNNSTSAEGIIFGNITI